MIGKLCSCIFRGIGGTFKNSDAPAAAPAPSSISTGSFRSIGSAAPQPLETQMSAVGTSSSAGHHSNHDASSSKQVDVPTATLVNTSDDPVSPVLSGTLKRQKASSPGKTICANFWFKLFLIQVKESKEIPLECLMNTLLDSTAEERLDTLLKSLAKESPALNADNPNDSSSISEGVYGTVIIVDDKLMLHLLHFIFIYF